MVRPQEEPWIGIDLGTVNSRVGIWRDGRVNLLLTNEGGYDTGLPSVVAFKANNTTDVGKIALNQAQHFPKTTIYDSKRLIGRRFTDSLVTQSQTLWPFTIE